MGLRSNNGNDKKAALRQLGDQPQQRPATMYASEQSLPDRLTQALRALRPAALSHSSSGSSPFRNKVSRIDVRSHVTLLQNGAVAADDVVYYAGSEQQKPPRPQPAFPTDCTVRFTMTAETERMHSEGEIISSSRFREVHESGVGQEQLHQQPSWSRPAAGQQFGAVTPAV